MMKKSIWIILLLAILCLTSCKKEIVNNDIYGVWMLTEPAEQPSGYTKLEFMYYPSAEEADPSEDPYELWIDPVTSDTIYHYKSIKLKGDSLLLTDDKGITYCSVIDELHDSLLVLSNINGTGQEATYKRIAWNYETLDKEKDKETIAKIDLEPIYRFSTNKYSSDSLDVVLKSTFTSGYCREFSEKEEKFIYYPYHSITKTELKKARNLLKDYMDKKQYLKDYNRWTDAYPFDGYFRQYYSYIKNGHVIVKVELSRMFGSTRWDGYTALKKRLQEVHDGGICYGNATIDLSTGKILHFGFHGEA